MAMPVASGLEEVEAEDKLRASQPRQQHKRQFRIYKCSHPWPQGGKLEAEDGCSTGEA